MWVADGSPRRPSPSSPADAVHAPLRHRSGDAHEHPHLSRICVPMRRPAGVSSTSSTAADESITIKTDLALRGLFSSATQTALRACERPGALAFLPCSAAPQSGWFPATDTLTATCLRRSPVLSAVGARRRGRFESESSRACAQHVHMCGTCKCKRPLSSPSAPGTLPSCRRPSS